MNSDASDFLACLLFLADNGERETAHVKNWTVHQFHPEFTAAVESFISGFRDYCFQLFTESEDYIECLNDPDEYTRGTFGGNVFLSLSGAGCGFQDDDETKAIHEALLTYSGDRYRFEQLNHCSLCKFSGKIHLAYRTAAFRREYLAKLFTSAVNPAPVSAYAVKTAKGYLAVQGREVWFEEKPVGWALFTSREGATAELEANHSAIGTAPHEGGEVVEIH